MKKNKFIKHENIKNLIIIDTKKLFGHHITDMLLIAQRIFIAICGEEKMMKAYYVTNDFEKIFDSSI